MYNQITSEHSLFFIDDSYITNFQQLAENMKSLLTIDEPSYFNTEDMWIAAFNFWVLSHPEEKNIVQSFDKMLYYSSDQIMIIALKGDYYFNYFRSHPNTTPEYLYILSILLTKNLNSWYVKLLIFNNQRSLIKRTQARHYFLMHLQDKSQLQSFMKDQASFVKILIHHFSHSNEFERLIKKSCDEASFFYQDFIENKSYQTL